MKINLSNSNSNSKPLFELQNSVRYLGYSVSDVNGYSEFGFMQAQLTSKDGRRFSTAKSFLGPALRRKNLDILLNSYVTKILISQNDNYG